MAQQRRHRRRLVGVLAVAPPAEPAVHAKDELRRRQLAVGITMEDLETVLHPMVDEAKEAIGAGDIYQVAEVVRNLALREHEKGLSTGEKQMYTRAKKILASELMYALEKDEDEAEAYLDDLLADSANGKMAAAK